MTVLIVLGAVLVLIMVRVPVAFAIMLACFGYVLVDDSLTMGIALQRLGAMLNSFPLLAVPLFITVGFLAHSAGMAERLVQALLTIFGNVRGSLGYVNVSGCVAFSWISGSATADAAAMGSVMIPPMRRRGYDPGFAAGLTGAASMIGPVMPPSVSAIIYGVLAGVSVGGVFLAGVFPALVIAATLFVYVYLYARKRPDLKEGRSTIRASIGAMVRSLPILVTPIIILGGILGGVFTPTEAAAVAVVYLLLLALGAKWITFRTLYDCFIESASTTGRVMIIAAAGGLFAYVLARERAPQQAADALLSLTDSPWVFLLLLNLALLVMGMVLEPASALLISVPVILPIALEYGIDPLHLGVIMILNLTMGLLTPPVGLVLYVLATVGNLSMPAVLRGVLPAFIPMLVALLIVTYVPAFAMALPQMAGLR